MSGAGNREDPPKKPPTNPKDGPDIYGFGVVFTGLMVVLIVFLVSAWRWTSASDVATAVASVTGVVGTLVGAFFGVQVGSAGKQKAQQAALHFAAQADPAQAKRILDELNM